MNKQLLWIAILLMLVTPVLGCNTGDRYKNDPIKWTFIGGDGNWNDKTRQWKVYLPIRETRSAIIQLENTGTQRAVISIVPVVASDTVNAGPSGRFPIPIGSNIQITLTAIVLPPWGPGTYTIDYSNSFDMGPDWKVSIEPAR